MERLEHCSHELRARQRAFFHFAVWIEARLVSSSKRRQAVSPTTIGWTSFMLRRKAIHSSCVSFSSSRAEEVEEEEEQRFSTAPPPLRASTKPNVLAWSDRTVSIKSCALDFHSCRVSRAIFSRSRRFW